jgi:hypothetical protein
MKEQKRVEEGKCLCPYCEQEILVASMPFCQACSIVFCQCLECKVTILDRDATVCPKCGAKLS